MRLLNLALIFLLPKIRCLINEIIEIIFPPCCVICGKLNKKIVCSGCKNQILNEAIYRIEKNKSLEYCFDKHIYIFLYKDIVRKLIIDYKFNDKSYLYKLFSEIIIKNEKICSILKNYDIIIPVPIHKKREKQRGYNQSELIAKDLAKILKTVKYENKIIKKIKNNKQQSSLTKEDRKQNTKNVYKVIDKEKIKNKKVIIFDDIYTTGNTVNEIAKEIKENEAKKIIILTLAKD